MTTSQFLTSAWDWNPWVMAFCAVTLWLCLARGNCHFDSRVIWLVLGVALFFLTLCSPIDALANGYLFSAHMLQHLLLLLIVPLLILMGLPERPVPRSAEEDAQERLLPMITIRSPDASLGVGAGAARQPCQFRKPLRRGGNFISRQPLVCWVMGVGGMWLWHAPALCNAAVANGWVHHLQYVSLLGMGLAFWWPIIGLRSRQRLAPLAGMIYLFSACLGCTILGIIITFSPVEVCSIYLKPVDALGIMPLLQDRWGLTPAKDQQLGGLLMWVPACLVYFFGILGLLGRWYREPGQETLVAAAAQTQLMEKPHGL